MRLNVVLLLCLVATSVFAEPDIEEDDDEFDEIDVKGRAEAEQGLKNPCNTHKCKRGEVCTLNGDEATCICQTCEDEEKSVFKVCSTKNVTYESECLLDRDHCLCKNRHEGCSDPSEKKVRLDYFANCQELTKCPDAELAWFPKRMREWLYTVMRRVVGDSGSEEYRDMLEKARKDENHAAAVVWKFCDLDAQPNDSRVTRRELMYIIASIKPMEHCLVRFLNKCDANNDHAISKGEWGDCLEIKTEEFEERCQPVRDSRG